jgi:ankyrin repeat protein
MYKKHTVIILFTLLLYASAAHAGFSEVSASIFNNDSERAIELVSTLSDVNERNPDGSGSTLLHLAIFKHFHTGQFRNFIRLLLENGADTNIQNSDGKTPSTSPRLIPLSSYIG